jgi:hypothetical protein
MTAAIEPAAVTLTVQPGGLHPVDHQAFVENAVALLLAPVEAALLSIDGPDALRALRTSQILTDARAYLDGCLEQAAQVLGEHHRTI